MRFRATIDNVGTFFKIIQAVEKLQRICVFKFNPEELRIICNSDANEGSMQVWSTIKIQSLFSEYRIQSNANDTITLSLAPDALLAALRSSSAVTNPETADEQVTVKLAKKNNIPVLSIEMTNTTRVGEQIRVAHDVRVDPMKPADVEKMSEPLCPEPDVHILLPSLTKMRVVVDRMKVMSEIMSFEANWNGHLHISIKEDEVRCETQWTRLTNPPLSRNDNETPSQIEEERDNDKLSGVQVPIRAIAKFLNSHVCATTTIACICNNYCLVLYVYIGEYADAGGVLTYYIPAMVGDD